jgi:transcriptional regulator with XRE-family HTH domain
MGDDAMETYGWFKDEFEKAKDTLEFKLESLEILLFEKIIARMEECKISRSDLASRMNTSKAYISKIFNNGANMTLKSMLALAEAIDCSLSIDLIEKTTNYQTETYIAHQTNKYPQVYASDDYSDYEVVNNVAAYC